MTNERDADDRLIPRQLALVNASATDRGELARVSAGVDTDRDDRPTIARLTHHLGDPGWCGPQSQRLTDYGHGRGRRSARLRTASQRLLRQLRHMPHAG